MATFGELKTKIQKRLQDALGTAVATSDVADAINTAVRYWKRQKFWFNESSETINLTTGNPLISGIPDDFQFELSENGFVIEKSQLRYPLKKVPIVQYDIEDIEGSGIPCIYTWKAGSFYVYPYPQEDYDMVMHYIKDYDDMAADSDTNDFTINADQMIMYEALSRLHGELRQDEKMEAYYSARAQNEFSHLSSFGKRKSGSGQLTIETIL